MRNQNHLHDYRQKVDLFLDNALNSEESQDVLEKSKIDPSYKAVFEKEKNFRQFIKQNVKRTTCSENLIQNILNQVG